MPLDIEEAKRGELIRALYDEMPAQWRAQLATAGGEQNAASAALSPRKRARAALALLRKKAGVNGLRNALRAVRHHVLFCESEEVPVYPVPADVLVCALQAYDDDAMARAVQRAEHRAAQGKAPIERDRGGETAVKAVHNGYFQLEKYCGLDVSASHPMVKAMAQQPAAMPTVRSMLPADALAAYERASKDPNESEFVRAYSGSSYLGAAGSTRVIDQIRTPDIRFERCMVHGQQVVIACGTAAASKGKSRLLMKPLPWRAPILKISVDGPVDLGPLLSSIPSGGGSLYRDFTVPKGADKHVRNATGWLDRPASHEVIVASQVAILEHYMGWERSCALGGHDQRHLVPEVARVLELPRHVREGLGYWRSQVVVAMEPGDQAAVDRAHAAARAIRCTRTGSLAFCSDRYSSKDGQPIEQDAARVACLNALAGAVRTMENGGLLSTAREQLTLCKDIADAMSKQ
jgi:hypothetical protein